MIVIAAFLLQTASTPAVPAPVCPAPLGEASLVVSPEALAALHTTETALRSRIKAFGCFDTIAATGTPAAEAARWRVSIMYAAATAGADEPARMMILDRTGAVAPITAELPAGVDQPPASGAYVGRSLGGTGFGLNGIMGAPLTQPRGKGRVGATRVPTAAAAKRPGTNEAAMTQQSPSSRRPLAGFAYGGSPSAHAMRIAFGKLAAAVPAPPAAKPTP